MKAEEIMRFDWVCLEDDNTPRQVDWIRGGEVGLLWNQIVTPHYLKPIPLTREILEKNGCDYNVGLGGLFQINIEGLNCHISFNIIHDVHELQHALRLCGIKKEIKL